MCPDCKFPIKEECYEETNTTVSKSFARLKWSLSRHFKSKQHLDLCAEIRERDSELNKLLSLNKEAGFNCGRAAYKNIKLGQSAKNYEYEIYLIKSCGGKVGELNHSEKFIEKIRPFFAKEVELLCFNYLATPLLQTAFRPPCAITADVGTYKHRSKQFLAFNCINPDSENLIESISISQEILDHGKTGVELCRSITIGLEYSYCYYFY